MRGYDVVIVGAGNAAFCAAHAARERVERVVWSSRGLRGSGLAVTPALRPARSVQPSEASKSCVPSSTT